MSKDPMESSENTEGQYEFMSMMELTREEKDQQCIREEKAEKLKKEIEEYKEWWKRMEKLRMEQKSFKIHLSSNKLDLNTEKQKQSDFIFRREIPEVQKSTAESVRKKAMFRVLT